MNFTGSWIDLAVAVTAIAVLMLISEAWSQRQEPCAHCHGLGRIYRNSIYSYKCPACQGTGKRRR